MKGSSIGGRAAPAPGWGESPRPLAHVVLLTPEIPQNVGNIGRSCLAFGAQLHLVRPLGFSLASSALRRAGLDYWEHVNPVVWPSWEAFARELSALGEPYLFSSEGVLSLFEVVFPSTPVLIFGRESAGLPSELRQRFRHRLVRIPMVLGPVRSLNLATSAGIVLAELFRRRVAE